MKTQDTTTHEAPVAEETDRSGESIHDMLHDLKHHLPAQAPLKDFIHQNTLHFFQHLKFQDAVVHASHKFGYNTRLSLAEYRNLYDCKKIKDNILNRVITGQVGAAHLKTWKEKVLTTEYRNDVLPRIGALRAGWRKHYKIDLDSLVHPTLFRILCSYLDQGISMWNFPVHDHGLLSSVRELEKYTFTSFFRTARARKLIADATLTLEQLLKTVVGDEAYYKQYLFDQQFAHQGWSGLVSTIESDPVTLLDRKKISIEDLAKLELILEVDALESYVGKDWKSLSEINAHKPVDLFAPVVLSEYDKVLGILQEAFEWSYYDEVLAAIKQSGDVKPTSGKKTFQVMFCIDDRECSFRTHLEKLDPHCETFGTPGFFNVEFYFQPDHSKFYTKLCPAPVMPKYLIKEVDTQARRGKESTFSKSSHTLFRGWLITQTLGFWSALKLFINIFKPAVSPATAVSFNHMDKVSRLTIEHNGLKDDSGLQIGFTIDEMVTRVEGQLKSIGLISNFAPLIYTIGHGSSSVNNPHYAAYDCGACSGRPGSVNARVFSYMANHPGVREILRTRGIDIPAATQFVGGLHDTTRDEIMFYDENSLTPENLSGHKLNIITINKALDNNAKERARRFDSVDPKDNAVKIHEHVKQRSVSLFQPRPELNHATNVLCIVGRRPLTQNIFLDRRSFLNSYDYSIDPNGDILFGIMRPLGPVCGGINLEYFFSRVDNQKLGAGTKLPHNVMGLIGVANGNDGDLRPGLPSQMIEVHDPVRLMLIVEHFPDVVLNVIKRQDATYEWFKNEWVHLVVVDPKNKNLSVFKEGSFHDYVPATTNIAVIDNVFELTGSSRENIPVHIIA